MEQLAQNRRDAMTPAALVFFILASAFFLFGNNYLLLHTFAELFTAATALVLFSVAWHARRIASSDYLTVLGMAAFPVGVVTILHALSYRGMNVLPLHDTDLPTQLWLIARGLQTSSFLIAPLFLVRRLRRPGYLLSGYVAVATAAALAAFTGYFPAAFIEGQGLTPFKINFEYGIVIATMIAAAALWHYRERGERRVLLMLWGSMAATIFAELAFTLYTDPYGPFNRLGHVAHLIAMTLIYAALVYTSLERPLTSLFRELKEREQELAVAYSAEHGIAETLQNAMAVQPEQIPEIDVSHRYLPAPGPGRIGGDFYDIFRLRNGAVAFAIGDVCGKGLKAATTTLKTRSVLRALAHQHENPAEVLEALNSYLLRELEEGSFVTAVFGTIDIETGDARVAIAGHPDPILCGHPEVVPANELRSQPLGVIEPLGASTWKLSLDRDESLVLVTDGVIEAPGSLGRFGSERLHDLLHALRCDSGAHDLAESVIAELHRHADEGLDDDVAVVVIRFSPAA